jgi:hypothetical protein
MDFLSARARSFCSRLVSAIDRLFSIAYGAFGFFGTTLPEKIGVFHAL